MTSTNTWCVSFVPHKTCLVLPDDVTIFNQLGYNTLDLNRLGNHTRMRGRVEVRITALEFLISSYLYPILRRSNWFLSQFLSFDYSAQKKILIITIQCLQTEGRGYRGCSIARLPCHFSSVTVFSCFFRLIAVLSLCHCYLPL